MRHERTRRGDHLKRYPAERRAGLLGVGAHQFGLGQDVRLGRSPDIGYFGDWRDHQVRRIERRQPEMVVVRAMPWRRTRAVVAPMTKVVDALVERLGGGLPADPFR